MVEEHQNEGVGDSRLNGLGVPAVVLFVPLSHGYNLSFPALHSPVCRKQLSILISFHAP